jgi:hypothetical protein
MEKSIEAKLRALCRWHPQLARGAMSWAQLRNLARRIGAARGVEVVVDVVAWPWPATARWVGDVLAITVDGRQSRAGRIYALAHEVGHLALGHCSLRDRDVWFHRDGVCSDEMESEADLFAQLATSSPGCAAWEAVLRDQLGLGI